MNRFLSYVLMPVAALALLIPVGCNQAPTQAPSSSSNTNNVGSVTSNLPVPQLVKNGPGATPKAVPAVAYTAFSDSKVSYTRTEAFLPYNNHWYYEYYPYYSYGIGILPNGNLVTADFYNSQVDEVNPMGAPNNFAELPATNFGNSQLYYPYGLAVDGQGNVYVANYEDSNVVKYSSAGVYQGTLSHGFSDVYNVTVDNAGNIYVVDGGYDNVQKFNSNFQFQKSWGHFDSPWGIGTDGTNIFVADYGTEKIEKYSPNGLLMGNITSTTGKSANFKYPYGLGGDGKGNIFVADYDLGIFEYNATSLAYEATVALTSDDEFEYGPLDVAVDPQGNVYCTDYYYMYKFAPKP
jgi:streptogramin lyase